MKSFLLLILSLTAGCEAFKVEGCEGGWVELTCKYPKDQKYKKIEGTYDRGAAIQTTKRDVWDGDNRFYLCHDTGNKNLRMTIEHLEHKDFGKYNCKFHKEDSSSYEPDLDSDGSEELELESVKGAIYPTTYERAETTITCDFPDEHNSYYKFICKDNNEIYDGISSTQFSVKSNGTFTLTDTNRFNMSISNVSSQHAGVYWCEEILSDRASCKKIQLKIKTSTTTTTTHGAIIAVVLLLLFVVIIVIFIYKRFSSSRNTRNEAAAQQVREDNAYEEVQERPQETGSGNAIKTIYATANFPTNPSDAMNYSTVTFQSSSDKANSEVLIHKPSSSACEYSTVKNSQSPIYSTVNKPSKTSEDPV